MGDVSSMSPLQVFHRQAYLKTADSELRLFYMECSPPAAQSNGYYSVDPRLSRKLIPISARVGAVC